MVERCWEHVKLVVVVAGYLVDGRGVIPDFIYVPLGLVAAVITADEVRDVVFPCLDRLFLQLFVFDVAELSERIFRASFNRGPFSFFRLLFYFLIFVPNFIFVQFGLVAAVITTDEV